MNLFETLHSFLDRELAGILHTEFSEIKQRLAALENAAPPKAAEVETIPSTEAAGEPTEMAEAGEAGDARLDN